MSILVDRNTRVVVQGITGSAGSFHSEQMLAYGTQVVGGVTPGRGGTRFQGQVPIFNTVEQAVRETGANAAARQFVDFKAEYAYVVKDLQRVGIVVGSLLAVLIVLYFVLPH